MAGSVKEHLRNATQLAAAEAKGDSNPAPPAQNGNWKAPGRLGDPKMTLSNEPRVDAKLLATISAIGIDKAPPPSTLAKLSENSSMDEIAAMMKEFEDGLIPLYDMPNDLPEDKNAPEIVREDQTIKGGDGQDMLIHIYRAKDQSGPLPCVVYTHGGGMVVNKTLVPPQEMWCKSLVAQGLVVIMVDFRNAYTREKYHPFPAGLNDCVAAVQYISLHRSELKISNIVLQGESGGANLAIATTLKANREGWVKEISGVYGVVPYVSNGYGWSQERKLKELPSLVECGGYFLSPAPTAFMGYFYTPNDKDSTDPLAWPYYATEEDMKGLPPHIIVADELDMLRDEGISYARRLVKAGVDAKGSVNLGVTHATSLIFRKAVPEFHRDAVRSIASFAKSL